MNGIVLVLSRWLHQICLALWIGGLPVIGAIVAPVAFRRAGLETEQAGNVVGTVFLRFNVVCYVAGALILLSQLIEWGLVREATARWRKLAGLRLLMTGTLVGLTFYLGLSVAPQMFRDRAAGEKAAFDAAHDDYATLANVQLALAAGAAFLTAMMSLGAARATSKDSVEREEEVRHL
ncbi:MAG: DUF4149 domain-containing protein [Armatimonadetes bacterium]|nr:DUF4149 domain-containing protein [Armatimonadota bacterium]